MENANFFVSRSSSPKLTCYDKEMQDDEMEMRARTGLTWDQALIAAGHGSRFWTCESERPTGYRHDGSVTVGAVHAEVMSIEHGLRVPDLQEHFEDFRAFGTLLRVQICAEHGDLHGQKNLRLVPRALQGRVDGIRPVVFLQRFRQPQTDATPVLHHEIVRGIPSRHQLRHHHAIAEHVALLRVSAQAQNPTVSQLLPFSTHTLATPGRIRTSCGSFRASLH